MKNRYTELYLCSFAIIAIGFIEIIFDHTEANFAEGFYLGNLKILTGVILLIFALISQSKSNTNRKQLERELSKEYDERDDLIEGKASQFTMSILMIMIILMMFLSNWIIIPINAGLFLIIICCLITKMLAKKYYSCYF
ncbi:DUF2178 domain-containing protein [Bacillus wiedmannii]|uniref:DUF2178 domain-containing protein n=1 Tax=Bacillus wiedmannii TaxID=1890302 RepID=UPI000BF1C319|nr:DUF2178 domain-containing protein [Bacillus wiedmannii]PEO16424.1 hypothetical protein CN562_05740 [Bacillus wiedmannii]PEQ03294.1 hypothetical protein CN587_18405 [Bacillus wiedmannii]PHB36255.1 hypothetical protein COE82_25580 [Bacillus wiedmannii]PHC16206.1 hypothetical protein COF00_28230 [Bacillus wiedmannii]PHC84839.1 hypothetical protein COF42_20585 [Bacillus wiedmannii]